MRRGSGKPSPRKQVRARGSPATWETAAAAPAVPAPQPGPARPGTARISPLTLQSGGFGCLSPLPPPVSPRSWAQPLPVAFRRWNEAMPPFIYVPRPSFPTACAPPLTDVDDGVRPHRNALKYPGEKPEHQHFHFQPLAQHISPGLVARQTGEKKRKRARAGGARRRGGRCPDTPLGKKKKIPNSHGGFSKTEENG